MNLVFSNVWLIWTHHKILPKDKQYNSMKHVKEKTHQENIDVKLPIDMVSFDNSLAYVRLIISRFQ